MCGRRPCESRCRILLKRRNGSKVFSRCDRDGGNLFLRGGRDSESVMIPVSAMHIEVDNHRIARTESFGLKTLGEGFEQSCEVE